VIIGYLWVMLQNLLSCRGDEMAIKLAAINNKAYFVVKNEHGDSYLCPINSVKRRGAITADELASCVEEDIVERYFGNIDIEPE